MKDKEKETKNIIVKVPKELHKKFKASCQEKELFMQQVLIAMIKGYLGYGA